MTDGWGHYVFIDEHQTTDVTTGGFGINNRRVSRVIESVSLREEMPIYNLTGSPTKSISKCKHHSSLSLCDNNNYSSDYMDVYDEEKEGKSNCSAWSLFCCYPNARFNRRVMFIIFYLGIHIKCIATNIKFTRM